MISKGEICVRYGYYLTGQKKSSIYHDVSSSNAPVLVQRDYSYYKFGTNSKNSQLLRHDGESCYLWGSNGNLACKWQAGVNSCSTDPHASCPGILISEGDSEYSWDIEDRLIGMQWYEDAMIHNSQYFYDHNGDRYRKVVDGVLTNYFYHHEDIVKEQVGAEAYEYLHGPGIDEPAIQLCLGINCPVASSYYYADGLGSIHQLADSSGNILNQYRYGAWGEINEPFIKSELIYNNYLYTSREYSENSLYYYRARYYNDHISYFISDDNLKYEILTVNSLLNKNLIKNAPYILLLNYKYSNNAPNNYIDAYGKSAGSLIAIGLGLFFVYNALMCIIEIKPCADTYEDCRILHSNLEICIKRGEDTGGSASGHLYTECFANNPACQFRTRYCESVFRTIYFRRPMPMIGH